MGNAKDLSSVHVEGEDDLHTLMQLLRKHEIELGAPEWQVEFQVDGNDMKVLSSMETAIRAATNRSIGFVIDANSDISNRWGEIRRHLDAVKVPDLPKMISKDAFIGKSEVSGAKVGVWLMPDNEHDGNLENFLRSLVADKDQLIGHAEQSTDEALKLGATFRESDKVRAVVRTWLAWQDEPGHPYGRAIQRKYFTHKSEVADRFVAWFRQLFSISE